MTLDYLIGAQLDEYRLESLLGRGGMARVYRALDVNLARAVAIKVIDIPHRAEAEYIQRFRREAQAIAQLDHTHIVRLYRYGEAPAWQGSDRVLYMAMQFIEGADLQFVLGSYRKDGERIESEEAVRIIREVCSALDYAHSKGIIHRDVKTSNIMLDTHGRAILTDFGLAMLSTQATRGETFGSPHYIAPEQAMSSAKAVPQSDLYAVGVILYEMFTGVLPFSAAEPLELAMMHITHPVPSPREVCPHIDEALEAVILKALEKRPEDRYQTGKALSDALEAALSEKREAVPATQLSIPGRIAPGQALPHPPAINAAVSGMVWGAAVESIPKGHSEIGTAVRPEIMPTIVPWKQIPNGQSSTPGPTGLPTAGGQPGLKKQYRPFWLVGILASLLLIFLCLGAGGLVLANQFLAYQKENPVTGIATEKMVTATATKTKAAETRQAVVSPTYTPIVKPVISETYQFQINREGEDKGYFLITNTGTSSIPLAELSLHAEKGQLSGEAWRIEELSPGACLLARKEDKKDEKRPAATPCNPAGLTATISNAQDGVFKERLDIYWGGKHIGTCEKEEPSCQVYFTN